MVLNTAVNLNDHPHPSATSVSTVVAESPCSAKTSELEELVCLAVSPNTLPSEPTPFCGNGGESFLIPDRSLCAPVLNTNYTRSKRSRIWTQHLVCEDPNFPLRNLTVSFPPTAEPLACAIHGVDVIQPKVGSEGESDYFTSRQSITLTGSPFVVLLLGAGPTG